MALLRLPYEILFSIIEMSCTHDILSLALTCHEMSHIVLPALYQFNIKHEGSSALFWAARHDKPHVAKSILRWHWRDINFINGESPLILAAQAGSKLVLELILQRPNVNVNLKLHGGTALWWAARNGHSDIVKRLLQSKNIKANEPGEYNRTPFAASIVWGTTRTSRALLETGLVSLNVTDDYGMTPLLLALKYRKEELAQELLSYKAVDVTCQDMKGRTPLFYATHREMVPVIGRLLVAAASTINTPNIRNQTPLFYAVRQGSVDIASMLLKAGADTEHADIYGIYPLMVATNIGKDMVELLLNHGAQVNATNEMMETPLHIAAELGSESVTRLLLDHGSRFNIGDSDGRTPLWLATRNGHISVARQLLALDDIDVNTTYRATTPLHEAVRTCQIPIIRMICAKERLNPNLLDRRGLTALGIAAEIGKPEIVEILLNNKSILVDAGRVTPLWKAAKVGNMIIIVQLIRAGADINFRSKGRSVLSIATREGNQRVVDLILRHLRVYTRDLRSWNSQPRKPR